MKKKLVTILLAGVMTMMLAACGGSDKNETPTPAPTATTVPTEEPQATATTAPTATPAPTEEPKATATPAPTEEPQAPATPAPTATTAPTEVPQATPTPEPTATTVPTEVADTYEKGIINDSGFESRWANLRFTAQHDVTMASQTELDLVMQQGAELLYGENADLGLLYAKLTTVTEMMAQSKNGANVIVQVERLTTEYTDISEKEYLDYLISGIKNNAAEITITTDDETYTVEIGGETYTGLGVEMDYGFGIAVSQEYMVRKKENRMIVLAVSYTADTMEEAQNLIRSFGAYASEPIVLYTPTPTPEVSNSNEGASSGKLVENVYVNSWLGLCFTAPEDATILNESADNLVTLEVTWPEGMPVVQLMTEKALYEGMTAEEYLDIIRMSLEDISGMMYIFDEEYYPLEIGGQEYLDLVTSVDYMGIALYQDYCVRELDGYMVTIIFTYMEGYEQEVYDALEAFTTY